MESAALFIEDYFAGRRATRGFLISPIETYRYMLADSRAKALFVSGSLFDSVGPALQGLPALEHVFC